MSERSILQRVHRIDDEMFARVIRVLRDTRNSDWGGTIAYRTGIDVLVTVHCVTCCCQGQVEPTACGSSIDKELRVRYDKADTEEWFRLACEQAAYHRARRH